MRRDAKKVWNGLYYGMRKDWVVSDLETYLELQEAFRGGNTHANRYFVAPEDLPPIVILNVHSYDRSSSYPDVMCNMKFPLGKWKKQPGYWKEDIIEKYKLMNRAMVFRVRFYNIRLKDVMFGCPYLSCDKTKNLRHRSEREYYNVVYDNGRIVKADLVETTITDVDYWIISQEYEWNDMDVYDVKYCRYQKLPQPFIDLIQLYYKNKTELKGISEMKWKYNESKSKINALYGMSAQKTVREVITYSDTYEDLFQEISGDAEAMLKSAERKAFLPYAVGVFVTAWARYWLERAILLIHNTPGADFIYTDTDSVKFIGEVDFTELNNEIRNNSIESGSFATDKDGNIHYMGVYEYEETYPKFATMGAKKYIYGDDENIHVTISGVVKYNQEGEEISAKELKNLGGFKAFKSGTCFTKAGGLEAVYNDRPSVTQVTIDGHEVPITRNVCLRPSTYTLGLAGEYERLLKSIIAGVDNHYI